MPPHKLAAEMPRTVGCSLPRPLYQRLAAIATAQDTTVSQVMRALLVKGLSDRDTSDAPDAVRSSTAPGAV
jgi:hypothetical protein